MLNECTEGGAAHWTGEGPVTIIGGNIERADISPSTPQSQPLPGNLDIGAQQEQMGQPKAEGTRGTS